MPLLLSLSIALGFHARLDVEEGDDTACLAVDFKDGAIRIVPEEEIALLVDVEAKTVTLLRKKERIFCRFDRHGLKRLTEAGIVDPSWFPWVYDVSYDLVKNLQVEDRGAVRLPNGETGRRIEAFSNNYRRSVAEYWMDPRTPGQLFFQWRRIYLDLWAEAEDEQEAKVAQVARLELYDRLKGLPWRMEERFRLLSRPRVLRLEGWEPLSDDVWTLPDDVAEKSVVQLLWEDFARRFERWFRPK